MDDKFLSFASLEQKHHHHHHHKSNTEPTILKREPKTQKIIDHCKRQLKLYRACPCGSGEKFRWCCDGKEMLVINTTDTENERG